MTHRHQSKRNTLQVSLIHFHEGKFRFNVIYRLQMSAGFVQILEFLKKFGKVIKNLEFFFKGTASAEALFFSVVKSHSILLVNCCFSKQVWKKS